MKIKEALNPRRIQPREWLETAKERAKKVNWKRTVGITAGVGVALLTNGYFVEKVSQQDVDIANLKAQNRVLIAELGATQDMQAVELRHFCQDEQVIGVAPPMDCDRFVLEVLQLREKDAQKYLDQQPGD